MNLKFLLHKHDGDIKYERIDADIKKYRRANKSSLARTIYLGTTNSNLLCERLKGAASFPAIFHRISFV